MRVVKFLKIGLPWEFHRTFIQILTCEIVFKKSVNNTLRIFLPLESHQCDFFVFIIFIFLLDFYMIISQTFETTSLPLERQPSSH